MAVSVERCILFGIVVYKEVFYETETFKSLLSSYQNSKDLAKLNVFIYDNSPEIFCKREYYQDAASTEVTYFKNPKNPGISEAYNHIGKYSEEHGFQAIVFLDQDTHLPDEAYRIYKDFLDNEPNFMVGIPKIMINGRLLSPSKYNNFRSSALPKIPVGELPTENISWINSGMMVQTDFFINSGGYNPEIQLDFSDHFFVEKIKKQGLRKVQILPLILHQNLSAYTNTMQQDVTRYRFFLRDLAGYRRGKNPFKVFAYIDLPRLVRLSMKHKTLQFLKIRLQK